MILERTEPMLPSVLAPGVLALLAVVVAEARLLLDAVAAPSTPRCSNGLHSTEPSQSVRFAPHANAVCSSPKGTHEDKVRAKVPFRKKWFVGEREAREESVKLRKRGRGKGKNRGGRYMASEAGLTARRGSAWCWWASGG